MHNLFIFLIICIPHFLSAQSIRDNSRAILRTLHIYQDAEGYIQYEEVEKLYGIGSYQRIWGKEELSFIDINALKSKLPASVLSDFMNVYQNQFSFIDYDSTVNRLPQLNMDTDLYVYRLTHYELKDNTLEIGWCYTNVSVLKGHKEADLYGDDTAGVLETYHYNSRWGWHLSNMTKPLTLREKKKLLTQMIHDNDKVLKLYDVAKMLKKYRRSLRK
ncbi:MAG: hypothetical protein ACKVTZ_10130 [Bacteroidia bacterium]